MEAGLRLLLCAYLQTRRSGLQCQMPGSWPHRTQSRSVWQNLHNVKCQTKIAYLCHRRVKQSGNCPYIGKFVSFVLCWISLLLITAVRELSLQCSCMHHVTVISMHMSYRPALQLVRAHTSPENTYKLRRIHERFILGVNTLYKLFYFH